MPEIPQFTADDWHTVSTELATAGLGHIEMQFAQHNCLPLLPEGRAIVHLVLTNIVQHAISAVVQLQAKGVSLSTVPVNPEHCVVHIKPQTDNEPPSPV